MFFQIHFQHRQFRYSNGIHDEVFQLLEASSVEVSKVFDDLDMMWFPNLENGSLFIVSIYSNGSCENKTNLQIW